MGEGSAQAVCTKHRCRHSDRISLSAPCRLPLDVEVLIHVHVAGIEPSAVSLQRCLWAAHRDELLPALALDGLLDVRDVLLPPLQVPAHELHRARQVCIQLPFEHLQALRHNRHHTGVVAKQRHERGMQVISRDRRAVSSDARQGLTQVDIWQRARLLGHTHAAQAGQHLLDCLHVRGVWIRGLRLGYGGPVVTADAGAEWRLL